MQRCCEKKRFMSAATEKPGGRTGRLAARWLLLGEGPWPTEMCGLRTRPLADEDPQNRQQPADKKWLELDED